MLGFIIKYSKLYTRISIPSTRLFFHLTKIWCNIYLEEFLMVCHSYFITEMTYELKCQLSKYELLQVLSGKISVRVVIVKYAWFFQMCKKINKLHFYEHKKVSNKQRAWWKYLLIFTPLNFHEHMFTGCMQQYFSS